MFLGVIVPSALGINLPLLAFAAPPKAPEALILSIQDAIASGDLAKARARLALALKSYPSDGGVFNLKGILDAQEQKWAVAEVSFRKAVQLAPSLTGAWLNLLRLYETQLGDAGKPKLETVKKASDAYRAYLKLNPDHPDARLRLATLLGISGDHRAALLELDFIPSSPETLDLRCSSLAALAAVPELDALAAANPRSPRPLTALAQVAYQKRDLQGALGYLAHARDLSPSDPAVEFFFGIVCVELDLPLEAHKYLLKAAELAPENPAYRYAAGSVTLQGFEAKEAIPHFEAYRRLKPDDPRGRFALGVALFQSGDPEAAAREFSAVAAKPETLAGARYYLGRIARQNGEVDEAEAHFRASIAKLPTDPDPRAELASLLIRRNDLTAARAEIDAALHLEPDHRVANQQLLVLYQRTKDARADEQQKRVVELDQKMQQNRNLLLRTIEVRPY